MICFVYKFLIEVKFQTSQIYFSKIWLEITESPTSGVREGLLEELLRRPAQVLDRGHDGWICGRNIGRGHRGLLPGRGRRSLDDRRHSSGISLPPDRSGLGPVAAEAASRHRQEEEEQQPGLQQDRPFHHSKSKFWHILFKPVVTSWCSFFS